MTDEKPFRPSNELDVEWLTERPANLEPIKFPVELDGMAKYMTGLRELLFSELILDNLFGVEIHTDSTLEDAAQQRHDMESAEWKAKHDK